MNTWRAIVPWLRSRQILYLLALINGLGTIYGYIWYIPQLRETEPIFLLFVPDSPTASLFFTIVLIGWLLGRQFRYMEALAYVTLIKYGLWAVVMNLLTFIQGYSLGIVGWMLIVSHGAMALQAIVYGPFYTFHIRHLVVAGIWTLHNDVIDYVFEQMPVYYTLMDHLPQIGYFTFWLSVGVLLLAYWNVRQRQQNMENLSRIKEKSR